MTELHVVRVLASDHVPGSGGLVGIVLAGEEIDPADRQAIAARRGLPEIVFVDDRNRGAVRVHTPTRERPYAGYPFLGAAWLLHQHGWPVDALACHAVSVSIRCTEADAYMTIPTSWCSAVTLQEVDTVAELRAIQPQPDSVVRWSWDHRRERCVVTQCTIPDHPPGEGISASVAAAVGAAVGPPVEVELGGGSVAHVLSGNKAGHLVGGSVSLEHVEPIRH